MKLKGLKFAILTEKLYEDLELWYPLFRLREDGAEVDLVAPQADTEYPSKHGYPAKSTRAAGSVSAEDYDGLLIPGGFSPDHMRRDPAMVKLAREMLQQDKPVAAICHGGWMLASTGEIGGRKVTSFFSIKDDLVNAGGDWADQEVVVDGNLVTSRMPKDLPAYMTAYLELVVRTYRDKLAKTA